MKLPKSKGLNHFIETDECPTCWFCNQSHIDDMLFSTEYNTNVHKHCIDYALFLEPTHPVALAMVAEFKEGYYTDGVQTND